MYRQYSITHYMQQKDGGIEHNEVMGLTKLHVVVYLMVLPLTTQYQLCVCGDTSWWRGQALKLGHSYTNLPCTNTDGAQQFSTRWGYEGVAGVGESESGFSVEVSNCWLKCISNKMCSAQRFCLTPRITWDLYIYIYIYIYIFMVIMLGKCVNLLIIPCHNTKPRRNVYTD